jgi:hypothetical protein
MNIKLKSVKVDNLAERSLKKNYLYKDIAFDLVPALALNNQLHKNDILRDVAALYDVQAVKNSVATAFLTSPGQKILNPLYGVDLRQYIFEPVDNFLAIIIKDDIRTKLPRSEPRINVGNVSVVGNADDQTYYIDLQIDVPSLGIYGLSIKSQLNSTGYSIV